MHDSATQAQGQIYFRNTLALFAIALAARAVYATATQIPVTFDLTCAHITIALLSFSLSIYTTRRLGWHQAALVLNGMTLFAVGSSGMRYMMQACFYSGRANGFIDKHLAWTDQSLGFDWMAYVRFFDKLVWSDATLGFAYQSIAWQPVAIIILLASRNDARRVYAFLSAQMLGLIAACAIAACMPALGAFQYYGMVPADHPHLHLDDANSWITPIFWLRSGHFDHPVHTDIGLVTFPSFHTMSALFYMWAASRIAFFRWPIFMLNFLMLIATPIYGSHYIADMIAGGVLATLLIAGISKIYGIGEPRQGVARRAAACGLAFPVARNAA